MTAGAAPRLNVGVISAGAVGTAIGQALARAGHRITGVVARSTASQRRAQDRLPDASISTLPITSTGADLIIVAVPDPILETVAQEISEYTGPGTIVMHTAGSRGLAPLIPVAQTGATVIAAHPAMTFIGSAVDTDNLSGCPWGVTAADEVGGTVAELLISEMGGRAFPVPEASRPLYHAAMAHGSNHVGAIVADAVDLLTTALGGSDQDESRQSVVALLGPLLHASLDNTLSGGAAAITGPAARGDEVTVGKHLEVISQRRPHVAEPYRAMALRIAQLRGSDSVLERFSR